MLRIRKASQLVPSSISQFYDNANILLTGGTGFVGKVFVEKLLRSCKSVDTIYVLIRPKKNFTAQDRLKQLLGAAAFENLRRTAPATLLKVKAIAGDVEQEQLGLSEIDRELIKERIDMVFHSAALIKFNADLQSAILANVLGTKRIIELCGEIKNLRTFVHVSTSYSNADRNDIEEKTYKTKHDPNGIIQLAQTLPSATLNEITPQIIENHPNCYTFSKKLAEKYVMESFSSLPATAIVRPSIVCPSWREPMPGWVDNLTGVTGVVMEFGRGALKSGICESRFIADLVPVDVTANTLIAAAWYTTTQCPRELNIYNCTSGDVNQITWGRFVDYLRKHAITYPTKYIMSYPKFTARTNRTTHALAHFFQHLVPAYMQDIILYLTNRKPIMVKTCKIAAEAARSGDFATITQYKFKADNFKKLIDTVNKADDGKTFQIDFRNGNGFEWDQYLKNYLLGIRKFILKDELESLDYSRVRLNRLYWRRRTLQIITLSSLITWSILTLN
ncbi:hypothetical protein RI129_012773 [Pyrocoelia pectoralis]|uniref:Fatty acyl-CoA reductase n=1 Tax=Pyrocoelia pectoralis TaxID=417401 RepID=A0AAN7V345_9COLE